MGTTRREVAAANTSRSSHIKILSVFGTRPEAIKMAPVLNLLRQCPNVVSKVCVTGQHRDMLDQVLRLFQIRPDYDLNLMRSGQTPTTVAAAVMSGLEPILEAEKPEWVLVQGDTTTSMAASIAASYGGAKVGHIEAGLRTHDKNQPFPEELNRRMTAVAADLHFAPTASARLNLLRENVPSPTVVVTGNPVIDALRSVSEMSMPDDQELFNGIPTDKRLIMITTHRRENFGKPLREISRAVREIAERYGEEVHVAYVVHPNPLVQVPVRARLSNISGITLLPPLEYLPLVHLLKRCWLVLTDSGGIQEEAPGLGKPVLVLRNTTERPEAVEAGAARLVGTRCDSIVAEVGRLLADRIAYETMAHVVSPYGDGHAAQKIITALGRESGFDDLLTSDRARGGFSREEVELTTVSQREAVRSA